MPFACAAFAERLQQTAKTFAKRLRSTTIAAVWAGRACASGGASVEPRGLSAVCAHAERTQLLRWQIAFALDTRTACLDLVRRATCPAALAESLCGAPAGGLTHRRSLPWFACRDLQKSAPALRGLGGMR